MTIDALAEKYRLKVTRDECNDKIIQGRRGHLYVDAGKVCAMWLDVRPILKTTLAPLGGKQWLGSITEGVRRLQDVKVTGIAADKVPLAIRLTGCKYKRIMSEAQAAVLEKARTLLPPRPPRAAGA